MKFLESIKKDNFQIDVFECECGCHIGMDATLENTAIADWVIVNCPSCKAKALFNDGYQLVEKMIFKTTYKSSLSGSMGVVDSHFQISTNSNLTMHPEILGASVGESITDGIYTVTRIK